jgi:hypothetical protein
MKQFMLFLKEDLDDARKMTEEQLQEDIAAMVKWVEDLSKSGNYVSGDPLEPDVKIVKKESIVSDGPFIETKEAVSGYLIIKAETFEQAAALAQGCPQMGKNIKSIEVRPVLKF